jgi:hypothetical protein
MPAFKPLTHADRMQAAAEAKKAMLAKFKPKPTIVDPNFDSREAEKAAELERVRQARAEARAEAKRRQEEAEAARQAAIAADEGLMLELKRQERKDRKAAQKEQAKAKKDRLSAYKNMRISA